VGHWLEEKSIMSSATVQFDLGEIVITPAARSILQFSGEEATDFLYRHRTGDFGDVTPEEWFENDLAVQAGHRIWSSYLTAMLHTLWIVTEADRSYTRVIAPYEF
jgi:hypothetical protein